MAKMTLKVEGMHCPSCEALIQDVLSDDSGVKSSKADYKKGEVVVEFDEKKTDLGKIKNAIEKEAGHKVNG